MKAHCVFATNLGSVAPDGQPWKSPRGCLGNLGSVAKASEVVSLARGSSGTQTGNGSINKRKNYSVGWVGGRGCAPWKRPLLVGVDLLALLDRLDHLWLLVAGLPGSALCGSGCHFGFSRRLQGTSTRSARRTGSLLLRLGGLELLRLACALEGRVVGRAAGGAL